MNMVEGASSKPYVGQQQHHGYCCHVLALLNALVYLDIHPVPIQGPGWMRLLATTGCRYCPPEWDNVLRAASLLGLELVQITPDLKIVSESLPVLLRLETPYDFEHAGLVVEVDGEYTTIANYRGVHGGAVVVRKLWTEVYLASDDCHAVRLLSGC